MLQSLTRSAGFTMLPELDGMSIEQAENCAGNRVFLGTQSTEKKTVKVTALRGVGVNILDYSKISISKMEQNVRSTLNDYFKDNEHYTFQVCYSDTDSISFCVYYKSNNGDLGHEIEKLLVNKLPSFFDTSNYDKDHCLYDKSKRKLLDRFQFENPYDTDARIVELVSSAVKEYSKLTKSKETIQKHKGVSSKVVYEHDNYKQRIKDIIFGIKKRELPALEPKKLELYRMLQHKNEKLIEMYSKKIFSRVSDKRYIFMDGITTCAYGHKKLEPIFNHFKNYVEEHGNDSIMDDECINRAILIEREIIKGWKEIKSRIDNNFLASTNYLL